MRWKMLPVSVAAHVVALIACVVVPLDGGIDLPSAWPSSVNVVYITASALLRRRQKWWCAAEPSAVPRDSCSNRAARSNRGRGRASKCRTDRGGKHLERARSRERDRRGHVCPRRDHIATAPADAGASNHRSRRRCDS